jgi:hypothetical protein
MMQEKVTYFILELKITWIIIIKRRYGSKSIWIIKITFGRKSHLKDNI